MKSLKLMALGLVLVTTVVASAAPPAIPNTPAGVANVLYARQFTLETGYKHTWRNEQPTVTTGTILVLEVNPDLVYPRQVAEPVLYVGNQTAERVNVAGSAYESGRVIAIVPGTFDLKTTTIWFGTPELPERVTANTITQQQSLANSAGIKPLAASKVDAAVKAGGAPLRVKDREALQPTIDELNQKYSPSGDRTR
jgi:hypothetical protein